VKTRHEIRDVRLGIPLSNIPSKVEIRTQPVFEAKINGAPFALRGQTAVLQLHETAVDINLTDLISRTPAYASGMVNSRLTSRTARHEASLSFQQPPGATPRLVLSGRPRCASSRRLRRQAGRQLRAVRRGA
jgi:hypothetical protein